MSNFETTCKTSLRPTVQKKLANQVRYQPVGNAKGDFSFWLLVPMAFAIIFAAILFI